MADISQLEVNGTTYDICDAIARDTYVKKSGDTVTGDLIINGAYHTAKSTNIDRDGEAPASDVYGNGRFMLRDNDGEFIGQLRVAQGSNGRMTLQLMVGNENGSNSEVTNTLAVRVDKQGVQSYTVSDPAAFRNAINAVACSNQSTLNAQVAVLNSSTTQTWRLDAVCKNSTNTLYEHYLGLCPTNNGIFFYDWTAKGSVWSVTWPLSIANGGTGLTANPSMLVNLGSTTADTVLEASPRPGITGTLAVAHGGTGVTTAAVNKVFAGPSSGSTAAAPSFRSLVAADIPNLAATKINSGTFDAARIPSLAASKITSGVFSLARLGMTMYINQKYTISDGYIRLTNSNIDTGTAIFVTNAYNRDATAMNYLYTVQTQSGYANIYVRKPDGTAGTGSVWLNILVYL